jgi:hypothetical protein
VLAHLERWRLRSSAGPPAQPPPAMPRGRPIS